MSLIVQMRQDLDAQRELADAEVESASLQDISNAKKQQVHSELPLFAAADQIKKQERMRRYKFFAVLVIIGVASLTVYLLMYARGQVHLPQLDNAMNPPPIGHKIDQASTAENVRVAVAEPQILANTNEQEGSAVALKINLEAIQTAPQKNDISPARGLANRAENSVDKPVEKNSGVQNNIVVINYTPVVEAVAEQEPVVLAHNNTSQQVVKTGEAVEQHKLPDKNSKLVKHAAKPSVERIDAQTVASARNALQRVSVLTVIDSLKKALEQHAGLIETSKLYISLLISSRQYAQAEQQLATYRSQYKDELAFTVLQGRLLIASENYTQALTLIEQQVSLGNMSYEMLSLQAAAYQSLQKWSLALQSYTELLRYDAAQPRWWLGLAIAHDALGNKGKAKQAYQRVVLDGGLEKTLQNYAKSRLVQL